MGTTDKWRVGASEPAHALATLSCSLFAACRIHHTQYDWPRLWEQSGACWTIWKSIGMWSCTSHTLAVTTQIDDPIKLFLSQFQLWLYPLENVHKTTPSQFVLRNHISVSCVLCGCLSLALTCQGQAVHCWYRFAGWLQLLLRYPAIFLLPLSTIFNLFYTFCFMVARLCHQRRLSATAMAAIPFYSIHVPSDA